MRKLVIANLRAHVGRLVLSVFAVVGGIGLMAGALVLSDTLNNRFDHLFRQIGAGQDVIVGGRAAFGDTSSEQRVEVPETLIATIKNVPGVANAEGTITNFETNVLTKEGKVVRGFGPPSIGSNYLVDRKMSSSALIAGTPPTGAEEITLDDVTLKKLGYALGDTIKVNTPHGVKPYRVVGVTKFGGDGSNGASVVNFAAPVAQQLFDHKQLFDKILVRAEPGVSQTSLARRVQTAVGDRYEAVTGAASSAQSAADVKSGISVVTTGIKGFAALTLFVGAFIIVNTFSILVAQRTRELGLLRALGASTGQVRLAVLIEAAIVGLIGSLVGVAFGYGLAALLNAVLSAASGQSAYAPLLSVRTVVTCIVIGLVVTIASGVFPSIKASRVAPLEAMRDATPGEGTISTVRTIASVIVLSIGAALVEIGLTSTPLFLLPGVPLVFIGAALVLASLARPLATGIGSPLARLGQASKLGRANAMRNPRRTAITASALMIGLTLVGAAFTFASSLTASTNDVIDRELRGDVIVLGQGRFGGLAADVSERIAVLPSVRRVTGIRFAEWKVGGLRTGVTGIAADSTALVGLDITAGTATQLGSGGVLVSAQTAKDDRLAVGQQLDVVWARTGPSKARVVGIYRDSQIAGNYVIGRDELAENTTRNEDRFAIVSAKPGQAATAFTEVRAALKDFPTAQVQTRAQFIQTSKDRVQILLTVVLTMLVLCIIIAIIGIVNTLALSVYERTREIGLLRAVGMQRPQVKRMIRVEAVIVALLGGVVGLALGVTLGAAGVTALHDQGITKLVIPYPRVLVAIMFAAGAGVFAAILPARRAVKLDILGAIGTE